MTFTRNGGAGRLDRPRRGSGLRARLAMLVAIPLLGVVGGTSMFTMARWSELQAARGIEHHVDSLLQVLRVGSALGDERIPSQTVVATRGLGVTPPMVRLILGFDPVTRLAEVRPASDAALADPRFEELRAALAQVRNGFDLPEDEFAAAWENVGADVMRFRRADTAQLQQSMRGLRSTAGMANRLDALLTATEMSDAASTMGKTLLALRQEGGEQRTERVALASAWGTYRATLDHLEPNAGPLATAARRNLAGSSQHAAMAGIVGQALSVPEDGPTAGPASLALVGHATGRSVTAPEARLTASIVGSGAEFRTVLGTAVMADDVLTASARDLADNARKVSRDAMSALLATIIGSGTLLLLTLVLTRRLAFSVSLPLEDLAERAARIANGQLPPTPMPDAGPLEVVVVTRAVNDLVANLRTLDRQVLAIASGELRAPVLDTWLPGDLASSVRGTVALLRDSIVNREELQARLIHQAGHDGLTGLPNRQSIHRALEGAIERARRHQRLMACAFIDLDGFKRANDTFGHAVGDEVLRACADRLLGSVRAGDTLGRLGGDEFVVVAEGLTSPEDALAMARRFLEVLAPPVEVDGRFCAIGASIGIAFDLDATASATSLLRAADLAVYRAKARGRGFIEVYDRALSSEIERRNDLEDAFRRALGTDQLWMAYQPVIDLSGGGTGPGPVVSSFEALIRWDKPGEGPVSPGEFVPVIERGPHIVALGELVLNQALSDLARWRRATGRDGLTVAVNLSVRHLSLSRVVDDVQRALDAAGLPPDALVVEVTETALAGDEPAIVASLDALRALGVRVALDDFGSGYSSVGLLARLPVDILKIDRAFTQGIGTAEGESLVTLMVGVGRALGLDLVAEGVEDAALAADIAALGCHHQQGWYHGRPVAAGAIEALLGIPPGRPVRRAAGPRAEHAEDAEQAEPTPGVSTPGSIGQR